LGPQEPLSQYAPAELPVQSVFVVQTVHVSVDVLQTGLGFAHSAFVVHCTHSPAWGSPVVVTHVPVVQSAAPVQPRQV